MARADYRLVAQNASAKDERMQSNTPPLCVRACGTAGKSPRLLTLALSAVYCALLLACTFPVRAGVADQDIHDVDDSAEIGLRPAYTNCVSGGEMTTSGMLNCAHDEFEFQDRRLNKAYKLVMSKLSASDKITLRNDERAWLDAKKERCAMPMDGGTTDQVTSADCEVAETARRAVYLEKRLHK
jgi:uncharacterized protein YecT (DUF1311 family)